MEESGTAAAVIEGRLDERLVERVLEAAADAAPENRIRDAVDTVVDFAEFDPSGTSSALWSWQADRNLCSPLEACLDLNSTRATLALGGAIQLARAELATEEPDLRGRMPELLRWLEGKW